MEADPSQKPILPECAVCMEAYLPPSVPKSLPSCGHTVCLKCLLRLERDADGRQLCCPECRISNKLGRGGVEAFQTNIAIQRIAAQLSNVGLNNNLDSVVNPLTFKPRKNLIDVPLSAPSSMSHSKAPIRVLMPHVNDKSNKTIDKRPSKPLPVIETVKKS